VVSLILKIFGYHIASNNMLTAVEGDKGNLIF